MSAWLEVSQEDLSNALRMLGRVTDAAARGEAILHHDGDTLELECGGASQQISATGEWPGRAFLPADWLLRLGSALPGSGQVRLEVKEGKLHIGSFQVSCRWSEISSPILELPLNPPVAQLLAVASAYSEEELHNSGLDRLVEAAKDRREELVDRAVSALSELCVTHSDIEKLVDDSLPTVKRDDSLSALRELQASLPLKVHGDQLDLLNEAAERLAGGENAAEVKQRHSSKPSERIYERLSKSQRLRTVRAWVRLRKEPGVLQTPEKKEDK